MATRKKVVKRKSTTPRTQGKKGDSGSRIPKRIFAIASPKSVGGISMFEAGNIVTCETAANFFSEEDLVHRAALRLQEAGFDILQADSMMINIAGSQSTFERAFNTKITTEERDTVKESGKKDKATFFECPATDIPGLISTNGTPFDDVLEGVALEEPRYLMAPSFLAPPKGYWHLDVPGDVSAACNADRAHRSGITGRGIRVAMVDSGWYRHPFFERRGYRAEAVTLGPGTANPLKDEVGHGTGESANLFAVAPDITLLPVKAMLAGARNTVLVNTTAAFNAAVGLNPDIITNSWGFSIRNGPLSASEQALAAAVAAAVAGGVVVVFSAGNGHWGFPGQHPDVISAGGVFMDQDGSLRASDYSSGFMSNIYQNRRVPDVSGLVGMRPRAAYIMLPVESGDQLDRSIAGGTHPNGDETTSTDGWAAFSGTSAAAPQVAGAAALIKQACARLTPSQVKDILMKTAKDVTAGRNHPNFNNAARRGPDTATGNGLVDANRAVLMAKIRCLGPVWPIRPLWPVRPIRPIWPVFPVRPTLPIRPVFPVRPTLPVRPLFPIRPLLPIRPLVPIRPILPFRPIGPILPPGGGPRPFEGEAEQHDPSSYDPSYDNPTEGHLTEDDVQALEDMIVQSDDENNLLS